MAALWPDTFVEEANLSFQISALRKALSDGTAPWIETVPKHGYRFAADASLPPPPEPVASPPPHATSTSPVLARGIDRRWRAGLAMIAAVLLAAPLGYVALSRSSDGARHESPDVTAVPLTAYQGAQVVPSPSPMGVRWRSHGTAPPGTTTTSTSSWSGPANR